MTKTTIRNFWAIFFGILAALAIALAVYYNVDFDNRLQASIDGQAEKYANYKTSLDNTYRKSLYQITESVKNIDSDLSKMSASNDTAYQMEMAVKIASVSLSASTDLSYLPTEQGENTMMLNKYINQVNDYSVYLAKKLANGEKLSAEDKASLSSLGQTASVFTEQLQTALNNADVEYFDNVELSGVSSFSEDVNNMEAFDYEKLIYDGPFSDSVEKKQLKAEKVKSEKDLQETLAKLFEDYEVSSIEKIGEVSSDSALIYEIVTQNKTYTAHIIKDGRLLLCSAPSTESDEINFSREECMEKAQAFCDKCGFEVKPVWVSREQGNVTYVNLAPVQEGIVIYPDLVKVAIDSSEGYVVGCEARAYHLNHTVRKLHFSNYNEAKAQRALSENLTVNNVGKAYIQKGEEYYLCYELDCSDGNNQYFVYLERGNLKEIEIFKVIEGSEGYTVM